MTGRVITYIDGFNLYFGMRAAQYKRYYWLDLVSLSRRLLKQDQSLEMVRYFTSRINPTAHDPNKPKRQSAYLDALSTLQCQGLEIKYGQYLKKPMKCQNCQATWDSHEEKMTDVNIACALLDDAYNDRFDVALVLSGDSDLTPPIRVIRSTFPNKKVICVFPPNRSSIELKNAANAWLVLGRANLHESQLPDHVIMPNGYAVKRPAEWV